MADFATELRVLRATHNISQIDMANRLSITPSYLSLIESGKKIPHEKITRRAYELFPDDITKPL